MKIAVIDDYQNAFKTLKCFPKLSGHEVVVFTDPETNLDKIAERLKDVTRSCKDRLRPRFVRRQFPKRIAPQGLGPTLWQSYQASR